MFYRLAGSGLSRVRGLYNPFIWCVVGFIILMISYATLIVINEFTPVTISDDFLDNWYFISSWYSFVLLAMCGYLALSYASILRKGIMLALVIYTSVIAITNTLVQFTDIPNEAGTALFAGMMIVSLLLFSLRFVLYLKYDPQPEPHRDFIYLIVNRPRSFYGLLGLLWTGIGGGFTIYHAGFCYWFSREKGILIKSHDPDWYKGRRIIYICDATPENICDLGYLPGLVYSIFNNCVFTPLKFKRRWSHG